MVNRYNLFWNHHHHHQPSVRINALAEMVTGVQIQNGEINDERNTTSYTLWHCNRWVWKWRSFSKIVPQPTGTRRRFCGGKPDFTDSIGIRTCVHTKIVHPNNFQVVWFPQTHVTGSHMEIAFFALCVFLEGSESSSRPPYLTTSQLRAINGIHVVPNIELCTKRQKDHRARDDQLERTQFIDNSFFKCLLFDDSLKQKT